MAEGRSPVRPMDLHEIDVVRVEAPQLPLHCRLWKTTFLVFIISVKYITQYLIFPITYDGEIVIPCVEKATQTN
jgi:hypothetical protein